MLPCVHIVCMLIALQHKPPAALHATRYAVTGVYSTALYQLHHLAYRKSPFSNLSWPLYDTLHETTG